MAQGQTPKGAWLLGEVPAELGYQWDLISSSGGDFFFRLKVWVSPKSPEPLEAGASTEGVHGRPSSRV